MNLCISKLYVMQYLGDKLENEMGGACGMCGEKREIHAGFGWGT